MGWLLTSVLVRLHSTMFTLYMVPQIFVDIVNSATTDPETAPDAHAARLFRGDGRVSGLECWHGAAGFLEDTHGRMKAAFLIATFFFISAFIIVTRWGCWKTGADPGSLKQQKGLKAQYSGIQASSTTAAVDRGPSNWTVSIPLSTTLTTWSDLALRLPTIPTSSEEPLNRFPVSNFTIGVYTGFTTGVGPRR